MKCLEYLILLLLLAEFSFVGIQIGLLYSSPISTQDPYMKAAAHDLLDCGRSKIPEKRIAWNLLDTCVEESNIRTVNAGKMPFIFRKTRPVAWVFKNFDKKNMFMAPQYTKFGPVERAYVVIHECTHLALNSLDYAYHWQSHYNNLTKDEHANNADSFLVELFEHCGQNFT